jgi:hypothetical protein
MGAYNSNEGSDRSFYGLKMQHSPNSKKKTMPMFMKRIKTSDGYGQGEGFSNFSGYLTDIQEKEYTHENKKKKSIELTFMDREGIHVISMNYNFLSRGIINTLCSLGDDASSQELFISLWESSPNPNYPGSGYYPMCTIRVGNDKGETVKGAYSIKKIMEKVPVPEQMFNGEIFKDYTALNNYFWQLAEKVIKPKLNPLSVPVTVGSQPQQSETPQAPSGSMKASDIPSFTPPMPPERTAPAPNPLSGAPSFLADDEDDLPF